MGKHVKTFFSYFPMKTDDFSKDLSMLSVPVFFNSLFFICYYGSII